MREGERVATASDGDGVAVRRGLAGTGWAGGAFDDAVIEAHAGRRTPAAWVWRPEPWVSFGPRDRRHEGYEAAVAAARERDYAIVDRSLGGRAVVANGTTVSLLVVGPDDGTIQSRYDAVAETLAGALATFGVDASRSCPKASFCPGGVGLAADGKIAGLAQRVSGDVAAVGAVLLVRNRAALLDVLEPVYDALEVPLDPGAVGSLARAGVDVPTDAVARRISTHLADTVLSGW